MPVCQHCGETGPAGALFCTKCGYTLPQAEGIGAVKPPGPPTPLAPPTPYPAVAPTYPILLPTAPYIVPAASAPGALGPIPPPPNAKYCTRCGTVIAQPAVYCPVCQQPQP